MIMRKSVLLCLLVFSFANTATLYVPGQYPDIMSAVAAASEGDTVLVSGGPYFGAVSFLGKNIVPSYPVFILTILLVPIFPDPASPLSGVVVDLFDVANLVVLIELEVVPHGLAVIGMYQVGSAPVVPGGRECVHRPLPPDRQTAD